MNFATADLLDAHPDAQAAEPLFRDFGGARAFAGTIATVRCFEDNSRVREALSERGSGRVLVVDGGGSLRCALLGDSIAALARDSGWAGIVINGCVRDTVALDELGLGVKALGSNPRPSRKHGAGKTGVPVAFGGITFTPGALLAADADGVVVLPA